MLICLVQDTGSYTSYVNIWIQNQPRKDILRDESSSKRENIQREENEN